MLNIDGGQFQLVAAMTSFIILKRKCVKEFYQAASRAYMTF